jgi:hypothetical protein
MFSLVVSDNWLAGIFRTQILAKILAFGMGFEGVKQLAFRTISQIGIRYRGGRLSETTRGFPALAPHAGDRFPWMRVRLGPGGASEDLFAKLDDTRFTLIVIGQLAPPDDASGLGDLLRVLTIPDDPANAAELDRTHVPRPSFYLLRPDGYVGIAGTHFDALAVQRYVFERLGVGNRADTSA